MSPGGKRKTICERAEEQWLVLDIPTPSQLQTVYSILIPYMVKTSPQLSSQEGQLETWDRPESEFSVLRTLFLRLHHLPGGLPVSIVEIPGARACLEVGQLPGLCIIQAASALQSFCGHCWPGSCR